MNLEVTFGNTMPVEKLPVEFVERKGKGHPDTLCDKAAEEMSIALSNYYLEKFGRIFHHNVDKCVLVGGQAQAWFGGGHVTEPILILFVGRAAGRVNNIDIPIESIAEEITKKWIGEDMHALDVVRDVKIGTKIRSGSLDLVKNFDLEDSVPLSNDTSFGVGYSPLTETELLVKGVENELNSASLKRKYPQIGEDIKVMGVRRDEKINLTVACAIVSKYVKNEAQYQETKDAVLEIAKNVAGEITKRPVSIFVNSADNFKEKLYYLTVTGTSAEHGDDGQVGRGNRANGLITPFRPMTLEATGGKNPVSHTGKIYNVVAAKIVSQIQKEHPDLEQVSCYLVSQIGKPINEPQAINVEVCGERKTDLDKEISSVVRENLKGMTEVWREIVKREHSLF